SLSARALLTAALADAPSQIEGLLESRDTALMRAALETLGARFTWHGGLLQVTPLVADQKPAGPASPKADSAAPEAAPTEKPPAGLPPDNSTPVIDCGLAGTVMRFVPPLALALGVSLTFTGDQAALARPMEPLTDALAALGASFEWHGQRGRLPFTIHGAGLNPQEHLQVQVDGSKSSQFVSALLYLGAALQLGGKTQSLTVSAKQPLVSIPHLQMSVASLRQCGLQVQAPEDYRAEQLSWCVSGRPRGGRSVIEPDLSNAGPFIAAPLVSATGGQVRILHWPTHTTQVGANWVEILKLFGAQVQLDQGTLLSSSGALRGIERDASAEGELVPTMAALALVAASQGHSSKIWGIGHLRGHETDRLAAIAAQARKLGGNVDEGQDYLVFHPCTLHPAHLEAYADHRMATFAAIMGLNLPGISLDDVGATAKTMPTFTQLWDAMLKSAGEAIG
ncbi:MAG: 3-phosphoshikimate 1-carboxyvinyltransferase, partial [Actinomyces graevenitzii]|nr:3-phosphoshikimate 1-carboxyvinyltransferase [Actinomyces graevenitzii]